MGNEKNLKILVIAMASVAVILGGVLAWIWIDRNGMIEDLTVEKEQLTAQMIELRDDYEVLNTNNDSLNSELEREREKVEQLIERVQKTEARNRSKIRQYEQELGTLRSIMRSYIHQIDSLNTLTITLRKEKAQAVDEAQKTRREYRELQSTADDYAKKVEAGSILKGRGINLTAINSRDRDTDRSSRARKLRTCLHLVENSIAEKGLRRIYIRVKGPDGILLTNSQQQIFTSDGEQMIYSAVREVDYQGSELEVCIFFASEQEFRDGVYTVDVYTEESMLGSADLLLR
jgi:hypothetical protein